LGTVEILESRRVLTQVTQLEVFAYDAAPDSLAAVTVEALDDQGQLVPDYAGTVHFTSTDGSATLPDDYTFTTEDQGQHDFTMSWSAEGRRTPTATGADDSTVAQSATVNVRTETENSSTEIMPFHVMTWGATLSDGDDSATAAVATHFDIFTYDT